MTPIYTTNFVNNPDEVLAHLLSLNWLEMTEARKEYFMSDIPRSYKYGKGDFARIYTSEPYTEEVLKIQTDLMQSYNVCFLNRYDTQKNQLGFR